MGERKYLVTSEELEEAVAKAVEESEGAGIPVSQKGQPEGVGTLDSTGRQPLSQSPVSVVSSSTAALGQTAIPSGKGGYSWQTGVGEAIDLREIIEGVKQEAEIAAALNTAMASLPPGARIHFPVLVDPILLSGEAIPAHYATVYYLEEAIELTGELTLSGPGMMNGRVLLRAVEGFTDSQLVRNWQSSDWQDGRTDVGCGVIKASAVVTDSFCTEADVGKIVRDARASETSNLGYLFGVKVGSEIISVVPGVSFTMNHEYEGATGTISCMIGEPDHLIAPIRVAVPTYYPCIHNLGFDPYGASNVACVARVHPQEQAYLEHVVYRSYNALEATNCYGRTDFANLEGNISGVTPRTHEICYGKGWATAVLEDGTCGGKVKSIYPSGGAVIRDLTTPVSLTAEATFSSSPLKFIGLSHLVLDTVHQEAMPPQEGPTRSFADGALTAGSVILKTKGDIIFSGHFCGRTVTDIAGAIPAGTVITRYISATEVEMSNVATATEAGDTITVGPDDACIRCMDCSGIHLNNVHVEAHFAIQRPWLRSTSSERNPEREPMSPPLVTGTRVVQRQELEKGWEDGAPFLEDYSDDELLRRLLATSEAFDPRQIQQYDGDEIVWWDGETSSLRRARVKPRTVPDGELWTPARLGLLAANGDPSNMPGTLIPVAGILNLSWIPVPWNLKITSLDYYLTEQTGNTFTVGENFVGLYNSAELIAKTADLSASWGTTAETVEVEHARWHNIGAPTAPIGSGVWMAILVNGTIAKMKFATMSTLDPDLELSAEYYRAASYGTALTSLPSTIPLSGIERTTKLVWGAIS